MANFLDKTGLDRFLSKIKSIFALKADTYTKSEVDTLVAEGGVGVRLLVLLYQKIHIQWRLMAKHTMR